MRVTGVTPGAYAKSFPAGMAHRAVKITKCSDGENRRPPGRRGRNLLRRYAPGGAFQIRNPPGLAADNKSGVCLRQCARHVRARRRRPARLRQAQRGATGFRAVPHPLRAVGHRHLCPCLSGCAAQCGHSAFVPVHDRNSVTPLSPRNRFWSAVYRGAGGRSAMSPDRHRPTATLF